MKNSFFPKCFLSAIFLLGSIVGGSAASKSTLVSLGDETFSIVRQANTGLTRDTATLKAEALQDATNYCATHGKQLKVISAIEMKPLFMTADYAKAKVVFKALSEDDPELKRDSARSGSDEAVAGAPIGLSSKPAPQGDLYSELIKLDELRQKGILTEDEFQTEKKKVLKRSK